MFKMGSRPEENSGIVAGFEREKLFNGTRGLGMGATASDFMNVDAAPDFSLPAAPATPQSTPSYQERFTQMVGDPSEDFQRGAGLSEYLALLKLGANIAGAPNQGEGFSGFVRSASKPIADFADEIGQLDRAKAAQRETIRQRREDAGIEGAKLDVTADLTTQELLNARQIAGLNALVDVAVAKENREKSAIILQDSLLLSEVIRGHPPESAVHKEALARYKKLNAEKTDQKKKLKAELGNNQAIIFQAQTDVVDASKNPTGLSLEEYTAKVVNDYANALFPEGEEDALPQYEEGYQTPQRSLDWFNAGANPTTFTLPETFMADGGRVDFQEGGTEALSAAPGMTGSSEMTGSPLTFAELRARLPKEVSNDVVRLLAASENALIAFAQIQTQDDIARFNQTYNTDLQLPAQQAV